MSLKEVPFHRVGRMFIYFKLSDIIHSAPDMQSLQDDMDNLFQWEQDWQMEFHPRKCQLLRITNKRKPFARDYDIHGHKL